MRRTIANNVVRLEWVPLVGAGPVRFGGTSDSLMTIPGMRLEELKQSAQATHAYYWSENIGMSVICWNGRIVSFACHRELIHAGINLIGLSESQAKLLFRDRAISIGEFPSGHTLEISGVGLELTIVDGRVTIASAFAEP